MQPAAKPAQPAATTEAEGEPEQAEGGNSKGGETSTPALETGYVSATSPSHDPFAIQLMQSVIDQMQTACDRMWEAFETPEDIQAEDEAAALEQEEIEEEMEELRDNIAQLRSLLGQALRGSPEQAAQCLAQAKTILQQISSSISDLQTMELPAQVQDDLQFLAGQSRNLEETMVG